MSVPVVRSSRLTVQNTNSTSWTLTFPFESADIKDGGASYVESGDLIVVNIGRDGTSGTGAISGFSLIFNQAVGSAARGLTFVKIATGSETDLTYTPGANEQGVARIAVFKNWYGSLSGVEVNTQVTGTDGSPDPGAAAPSWAGEDTYWRACAAHDNGTRSVTAYPSGFTDNQNSDTSGGGTGAGLGSAGYSGTDASVNPSAFTLDSADDWVAWVVMIRGKVVFDDIRQDIIDGLDGNLSETNSWDAERSNIPVTAVVRTSNTVVTITLPALSAYSISADEDVTATIPASALLASGDSVVATPVAAISEGGGGNITMSAESGSFAITGSTAGLYKNRTLDATTAGSYAITGSDASLKRGLVLGAESGSYAITGTVANLLYGRLIDALAGSYLITGTDANLEFGHRLNAEAGSYLITGSDAGLAISLILDALAGSYTISGSDVNFLIDQRLNAESGSYLITGSDASLEVGLVLSAESGSYIITGTDASFVYGRAIVTSAGSFLITGSDVTLLWDQILRATGVPRFRFYNTNAPMDGTFELTLDPPNLISPISGHGNCSGARSTEEAYQGSYSYKLTPLNDITTNYVTIQNVKVSQFGTNIISFRIKGTGTSIGLDFYVDVQYYRKDGSFISTVPNTATPVALDGSWQARSVTHTVPAEADRAVYIIYRELGSADPWYLDEVRAGPFTAGPIINGTPVTFTLGLALNTEAGSYAITGSVASLLWDQILSAVAGSYLITGTDATLSITGTTTLDAEAGSFLITGSVASLLRNKLVSASSGSYIITGSDAALLIGKLISAASGSYLITGSAAGLLIARLLSAESGSYLITGSDVSLITGTFITAEAGSFLITGSDVTFLRDLILAATSGSYLITGSDVTLTLGKILTATAGSYLITGSDVSFLLDRLLSAGSGSYLITGSDANLLVTGDTILTAESGSFLISGSAVSLLWAQLIAAGIGSYDITGSAASLLWDHLIDAKSGSFLITGSDVTFGWTRIVTISAGANTLGTLVATTLIGRTLLFKATHRADAGEFYRYEKFFLRNKHANTIAAGSTLAVDDTENYDLYVEPSNLIYTDRRTPDNAVYASQVVLPELVQGASVGIWIRSRAFRDADSYTPATLTLVASGFADLDIGLPEAPIEAPYRQHSPARSGFTQDSGAASPSYSEPSASSPVYTEE